MAKFSHFLGKNLRYFREKDGLSKIKLAEILGTSPQQIGHIERSETKSPNYFLIDAIADFFGVDVKGLVYEDLTVNDDTFFRTIKRIEINKDRLSNEPLLANDLTSKLKGLLDSLAELGHFNSNARQIVANPRAKADKSMCYSKEDIDKLAISAFRDAAKAEKWLRTPINALNGSTPYSKLRDEEGRDEVITILDKIASGEFT